MGQPVVLSYGLGVDSTAILLRWPSEPSSRDFDLVDLTVVERLMPASACAAEAHCPPEGTPAGRRGWLVLMPGTGAAGLAYVAGVVQKGASCQCPPSNSLLVRIGNLVRHGLDLDEIGQASIKPFVSLLKTEQDAPHALNSTEPFLQPAPLRYTTRRGGVVGLPARLAQETVHRGPKTAGPRYAPRRGKTRR